MTKSTGLAIAVASNSLIGLSYVIKKKGLNADKGSSAAASYIYQPIWWAGLMTMLVGEIGNSVSYAYAPAFLVTPMGACAVFVNAFLSQCYLGEKMTSVGHFGMVCCVIGILIITLYAPIEPPIESVQVMEAMMMDTPFLVYSAIAGFFVVLLMVGDLGYMLGQKFFLIYVLLCALVGSFAIICIKGLGVAITATVAGHNQFDFRWENRLTLFIVPVFVTTILSQIYFLNRALDVWGASQVVPVLYVTFTACTITASQCLAPGMLEMNAQDIMCLLGGCFVTFLGVLLVGREVRPPMPDGESKKTESRSRKLR